MAQKKSDFIKNLTKQGFDKLCGIYFIIASWAFFLAPIPYYVTKDKILGYTDIGFPIYAADQTVTLIFSVLIAFGFLGIMPLLIAALKKYPIKAELRTLILPLLFTATSIIACILAVNPEYSVYGQFGRYDGALTQLAYLFLFSGAIMLTGEGFKKKLVYTIIIIGAVQAVVAILQAIPAIENIIPSYYAGLRYGNTAMYAANGFTCSPFFLASLMSIASALSSAAFMYEAKKSLRIFCLVALCLCTAASALTLTFAGLIAIACAILPMLIIEIVRLTKKHAYINGSKLSNPIYRGALALIASAVCFAGCSILTGNGFQDRVVAVEDGQYRLFVSGAENLSSNMLFYSDEWKNALSVISDNPAFGTGGDCYAEFLHGNQPSAIKGSYDRPYNNYLYIAASKGLPCLILYLGFIILTIKRGIGHIKRFYRHEESFIMTAITGAVIAYTLAMMVNVSSITVEPYFVILCGLVFSAIEKKAEKKSSGTEKA